MAPVSYLILSRNGEREKRFTVYAYSNKGEVRFTCPSISHETWLGLEDLVYGVFKLNQSWVDRVYAEDFVTGRRSFLEKKKEKEVI